MRVFRIAKTAFARDLSGTGARQHGGRWNQPGVAVIYTSESRALASLEYLVHMSQAYTPGDLSIVTLEIPDEITPEIIASKDLPRNWRSYPPSSELADMGTDWILSRRSLLLQVPSAVVEQEHNILVNPTHPDISRVKIARVERYAFDDRLTGKKKAPG
jgi:RES domain-containing protein